MSLSAPMPRWIVSVCTKLSFTKWSLYLWICTLGCSPHFEIHDHHNSIICNPNCSDPPISSLPIRRVINSRCGEHNLFSPQSVLAKRCCPCASVFMRSNDLKCTHKSTLGYVPESARCSRALKTRGCELRSTKWVVDGRCLKLERVILNPQGWKEWVGSWTSTVEVAREEARGSQARRAACSLINDCAAIPGFWLHLRVTADHLRLILTSPIIIIHPAPLPPLI